MITQTRRRLLFASFPILLLITFTLLQSLQPANTSFILTVTASSAPQARFTYSPPNPHVNGNVTFDASNSTSNGGYIVDYRWDFGDGETGNGMIVFHSYNQSGVYVVTLNVTDSEGLWCTTSKPVPVLPILELTVTTDKPKYYIDLDQIQIQGNLIFDGYPVPDGLVALEVRNPANQPLVFRTSKTGTAPISGNTINITELFLSDAEGNPRNYAIKGHFIYVSFTVKNIGNETLSPSIFLNLYQDLYPLSRATVGITELSPEESFVVSPISISVPDWISVGNATVYVSVLSTYPHSGGYPYCPEKFLTFPIINPLDPPPSGTPTSGTSPPPTTNGTYNSVFKAPVDAKVEGFTQGNYTICVSAHHGPEQATSTKTIKVKLAGDANGDGWVDWKDLLLELVPAYGTTIGDPGWNPSCDFNGDGWIDWRDLLMYLIPFYGKEA